MRRREFITILGGSVAAWPHAALAQQAVRMRRIGVLFGSAADDPEFQARIAAFAQELAQWAGPTVATCGSTRAGPRPIPTTFADTRPNWPRSRRTSFWLLPAPQPWRRCYRRPALCRSCSWWS